MSQNSTLLECYQNKSPKVIAMRIAMSSVLSLIFFLCVEGKN